FLAGVFCASTFGARSSDAYFMTDSLDSTLFDSTHQKDTTFYDVMDHAGVFDWLNTTFLPSFLPVEINGSVSNYIAGESSLRVGLGRLRLLRASRSSCHIPATFTNISSCFSDIAIAGAETTESFHGYEWSESDGHPSLKSMVTGVVYPGSGYRVDIPAGNYSEAQDLLEHLRNMTLLDESSRALFLDFSAYNPNVNMFSVVTAVVEMLPSGYVHPMVIFRTSPLLRTRLVLGGEGELFDTAMVSLEIILYGLVFFFFWKDVLGMTRQGFLGYLCESYWRVIDLANYVVFLAVIVLRAVSVLRVESIYSSLAEADQYIDLVKVGSCSVF
ncbi:unnamed protein product, partial [Discosporangium mesarthrocarpum]